MAAFPIQNIKNIKNIQNIQNIQLTKSIMYAKKTWGEGFDGSGKERHNIRGLCFGMLLILKKKSQTCNL